MKRSGAGHDAPPVQGGRAPGGARRRFVIGPFLIAVAIGVVLLAVVQTAVSLRHDPLQTDLLASPAYVKFGFSPAYAATTDVRTVDWDLIQRPNAGPIVMSDLPEPLDLVRYSKFSVRDRDIEEMTILIPFTIGEQAGQSLGQSYPVLHLASIGENWEIFVNDHVVARQIYLDDSGRITTFRNLRDLNVPLEREFLQVGQNTLVLHILGAYDSKWTGLRYTSPYYIGSASAFDNYQTISAMIMCVLFAFTGLLHVLFFAFRRTDRTNLFFVGFTAIVALYYYLETQAVYNLVPDTAFGQRLDYAAMYVLVFAAGSLLETITTGRVTKVTTAYGVLAVVLTTIQWFFPIWFAYTLVTMWRYATIGYLVWVVAYDVIWRIYKDVSGTQAEGTGFGRALSRYLVKTDIGNIYLVLALVSLTFIVDLIDIIFLRSNVPLKGYGLLGFTMTMAFILARKYATPDPATQVLPANPEGLVNIGLTQQEMAVALLMISRTSRREIARKLNLDAATVDRCERAVRGKLGLADALDPVLAGVAAQFHLTKREIEMLTYLRDGTPTRTIATDLFISEGTVRSHVSSLMAKLGIGARQDVAAWLAARGGQRR